VNHGFLASYVPIDHGLGWFSGWIGDKTLKFDLKRGLLLNQGSRGPPFTSRFFKVLKWTNFCAYLIELEVLSKKMGSNAWFWTSVAELGPAKVVKMAVLALFLLTSAFFLQIFRHFWHFRWIALKEYFKKMVWFVGLKIVDLEIIPFIDLTNPIKSAESAKNCTFQRTSNWKGLWWRHQETFSLHNFWWEDFRGMFYTSIFVSISCSFRWNRRILNIFKKIFFCPATWWRRLAGGRVAEFGVAVWN